jgi:hypothetical protein
MSVSTAQPSKESMACHQSRMSSNAASGVIPSKPSISTTQRNP